MRTQTILQLLVALNVGLHVGQRLTEARATQSEPQILRGRGLEIVDAHGRIRASISLQPPASPNQSETVLLRLITERGRPTVKIGASEPVSGLSFAGPTGTNDSYLILQTKGTTSSLRLRNENGHEQVVAP
jgi:hypothetical protein